MLCGESHRPLRWTSHSKRFIHTDRLLIEHRTRKWICTFGTHPMLYFLRRIVLCGKPDPLFTDVALRVRTMR
jgi:hypothetical protein